MRHRPLLLDLLSLALLALIVVAFFWPLVFAGYWIPHGGGDLVSFLWPMYRFSARSLWAGEVPLWNPHLYSGAPYVADNQSGVFYPINLLAFAMFGEPSYEVMEGLVVFHIWLAGATTFALLRGMGLRRPAALLGGIAFALSDLFVTHIGNLNLNATVAWLPLLLLLTHRALIEEGRRSVSWAAGAGAVLAVAALAGHGQMLLLVGLALAGYVVYRLAVEAIGDTKRRTRLVNMCLRAALIVVIGMGGAALMLLPAREMTEHTGRGHLPYEEATAYSLSPKALVGLLAPGFYGRSATGFWGDWDRVEVGYAGVATMVLAAVGIGLVGASWVAKFRVSGFKFQVRPTCNLKPANLKPLFPAGFFVLLAAFGFLLALGRYTPLYGLLYRYVPMFDQVRVPARMIVLADLGLATLAAYGLDRLLDKASPTATWAGLGAMAAGLALLVLGPGQARAVSPDRVGQATTSIIVAAALLTLSGVLTWLTRWRRWMAWLLVGLLAVDLVTLGSTLEIEPNDPTLGFQHQDVVDFLRQDANFYRIEATAGAWQPDAALVHGLYDIDGIFNPLGLAPYHAYLAVAKGERGAPLYNLLAAKYVLASKKQAPGDEHLVPVYTENPQIDVYLNTKALPMALLVYEAHVVPSHTEAWNALFADFDPTKTVILENNQVESLSEIGEQKLESEDGTIEFVRYGSNEIVLVVEMPTDGWLVLSEVYYPGWQTTVDGERAEVLRADYAFRAATLPPGEHVVRMTFTPRSWKAGLAVSGTTWAGLAAWTAGELKRCLDKKRLSADLPPQQPMV
ncbi:MAG: YfhO family protein [Anaerolineae bacterium]|nr:YfhO family protein [Anaerolineae bacterium]